MASVSHTDTDSNTANLTTYSFTCTIGAGDGGRTLLFPVFARMNNASAGGIASATVDGITATIDKQQFSNEGANVKNSVGLLRILASDLPSPAASSVALSLTFNGQQLRAAAVTLVCPNALIPTPHDTAEEKSDSLPATPFDLNLDIDIPANGIAVGAACAAINVSTSFSWAGLTEDVDTSVESALQYTTALLSNGSLETPRTITATISDTGGGVAGPVGIAVSYAPSAAAAAARSYGLIMG